MIANRYTLAWLTNLVFTEVTMLLFGLNLALGNYPTALGLTFVLGLHGWLWKILVKTTIAEQMREAERRERPAQRQGLGRWGHG